nr:MAG TPA: hypothetical protein [Bacteriophage sp.]
MTESFYENFVSCWDLAVLQEYPSHIRRRTKNVMKINIDTNAIMSSDSDGTILWT